MRLVDHHLFDERGREQQNGPPSQMVSSKSPLLISLQDSTNAELVSRISVCLSWLTVVRL